MRIVIWWGWMQRLGRECWDFSSENCSVSSKNHSSESSSGVKRLLSEQKAVMQHANIFFTMCSNHVTVLPSLMMLLRLNLLFDDQLNQLSICKCQEDRQHGPRLFFLTKQAPAKFEPKSSSSRCHSLAMDHAHFLLVLSLPLLFPPLSV